MDLDALQLFVDRRVAAALKQDVDRALSVQSVNTDGTLNLDVGDGTVAPSQPALASYTNRAVGDVILARKRAGEYVILGHTGAPATAPTGVTVTVSDNPAPTGQGWEQVVTGQLWAKPSGLWCTRVTPAPPPAGGTLTVTATDARTYRAAEVTQVGVAEQGDYTGRGLQTGLFTFGTVFGPLSGRTVLSAKVTLHRRTSGGFTWGPVPVTVWRVAALTPPSSTPALVDDARSGGSPSTNATVTTTLDPTWAQAFATGSATALAVYSTNASENVELDTATMTFTY